MANIIIVNNCNASEISFCRGGKETSHYWAPRSLSDGGHGATAPLPTLRSLLRRDLPWRGRWIDEVGGQLRVARFGVLHGLLLHRAVAAHAVGQREHFDGGIVRDRRQQAEHGGDVLL